MVVENLVNLRLKATTQGRWKKPRPHWNCASFLFLSGTSSSFLSSGQQDEEGNYGFGLIVASLWVTVFPGNLMLMCFCEFYSIQSQFKSETETGRLQVEVSYISTPTAQN